MADPVRILDAHAKRLYDAWRKKQRPNRMFGPETGPWRTISNNEREIWRRKALAALRSAESVADELKREERERVRGRDHG